jgi:N-acetylglucosamine-6-phosphate deacetylase
LLGFKTVSQNIIEMVKKAAIPLADAVRMASETPAKLIGIDSSKGTLQKGKSRRRFFCPHAKKKKAPRHL